MEEDTKVRNQGLKMKQSLWKLYIKWDFTIPEPQKKHQHTVNVLKICFIFWVCVYACVQRYISSAYRIKMLDPPEPSHLIGVLGTRPDLQDQ